VPALLAAGGRIKVGAVVDRNVSRAGLVSKLCGGPAALTEIAEALPLIDAAIVALPHFLHAPASIQLLAAGKHVLVEKPMALNGAECGSMIAASRKSGAILCVGQMRRFCPAVVAAKRLLAGGALGKILRWTVLEGRVYDWPVASDFFFRRETAGGGVLIDTGAHTLDMLLWFFGAVKDFTYQDDSFGGVEADCEIRMTMLEGSEGYVELSRTRNLPGILEVEGTEGRLVLDFGNNRCVLSTAPFGAKLPLVMTGDYSPFGADLGTALIALQLDDWLGSIEQKREPMVTGEEGRRAVDFIENCYAHRRPLEKPWSPGRIEVAA
jgi:predicted dehydrogenase